MDKKLAKELEDFKSRGKVSEEINSLLDKEMKIQMKEYQKFASEFMFKAKKCFNLDQMGLGKTVESLGALKLIEKEEEKPLKVLIVVIPSNLMQWGEEISKFTDFNIILVSGAKQRRLNQYLLFNQEREKSTIILISYNLIAKDELEINKLNFSVCIFDEATSLKNPEGVYHTKFKRLVKYTPYIYLLTGTPVTVNLADFYNLYLVFNEEYLGTYEEEVLPFLNLKEYNNMSRKSNSKRFAGSYKVVGAERVVEFREKLEPFLIRRLLSDVATLNNSNNKEGEINKEEDKELDLLLKLPLDIKVIPLSLSEKQKEVFRALKIKVNRDAKASNYKALEMYHTFLKVCSSPFLIKDIPLNNFDRPSFLDEKVEEEESPKTLYLLKKVKEVIKDNKKVVIYVRYIEYLKYLQFLLDKKGIRNVTISGEEDMKEKEYSKQVFMLSEDVHVLFITSAGKFGLNIQSASKFIFLDIPYSPADILQYIGRLYRRGQKDKVEVEMLLLRNTLEEEIFLDLYSRQKVCDEFLNTNFAEVFNIISNNNNTSSINKEGENSNKIINNSKRGFLNKSYT